MTMRSIVGGDPGEGPGTAARTIEGVSGRTLINRFATRQVGGRGNRTASPLTRFEFATLILTTLSPQTGRGKTLARRARKAQRRCKLQRTGYAAPVIHAGRSMPGVRSHA